jgi:hypothetical protein
MVLPGSDRQGYLGDPPRALEEVHRMAFAGNIVEQVKPLRSSLTRMLTNSKSPSGNRPTDSSFVQHSPILVNFGNRRVRQLP